MNALGISERKLLSVNTKESFIILAIKNNFPNTNIILEDTNITESTQRSRNLWEG